MSDHSPISPPLRDLLAIFTEELGELRFGTLDKDLLEQAAQSVQVAAEHKAQAEAALDAAQATLAEARQALNELGHRALAYARIHAEHDPDLQSRLALIDLPSPSVASHAKARDAKAPNRRRLPRLGPTPALPMTGTDDDADLLPSEVAARCV